MCWTIIDGKKRFDLSKLEFVEFVDGAPPIFVFVDGSGERKQVEMSYEGTPERALLITLYTIGKHLAKE